MSDATAAADGTHRAATAMGVVGHLGGLTMYLHDRRRGGYRAERLSPAESGEVVRE